MEDREFEFDCVIAMENIVDRDWYFNSTDNKVLIRINPQSKYSSYNILMHRLLKNGGVKKLTDHLKYEFQLSLVELKEPNVNNDELVYIDKIDRIDRIYTYKFKSLHGDKENGFGIISVGEIKDFILKDQLYNLYIKKFIKAIDNL